MPHVTAARLEVLAPHVSAVIAATLAPILESDMPNYGVSSLLRRAHFMGQCCHETGGFTRFLENLFYTSPGRIAAVWPRLAGRAAALMGQPQALANAAYAGRNGNGDEASGDGWRFRGRGLFQITGRAGYAAAGKALGRDLLADPDWVSTPEGAVESALWFWRANGCNGAADMDDCEHVTRIINGPARDGLTQRLDLTEKAKRIFA